MDHINNELPNCSVLIGDFNTRCSKWCNNITNAKGPALDTLTSPAGYTQIINTPTHTVNNLFSCIGLTFSNLNIISNYGVDLSIFDVIIISFLGKLIFVFPFTRAIFVKSGIIEKLMLIVYKMAI